MMMNRKDKLLKEQELLLQQLAKDLYDLRGGNIKIDVKK